METTGTSIADKFAGRSVRTNARQGSVALTNLTIGLSRASNTVSGGVFVITVITQSASKKSASDTGRGHIIGGTESLRGTRLAKSDSVRVKCVITNGTSVLIRGGANARRVRIISGAVLLIETINTKSSSIVVKSVVTSAARIYVVVGTNASHESIIHLTVSARVGVTGRTNSSNDVMSYVTRVTNIFVIHASLGSVVTSR
jgi:hypothetical protein